VVASAAAQSDGKKVPDWGGRTQPKINGPHPSKWEDTNSKASRKKRLSAGNPAFRGTPDGGGNLFGGV